MATYRKPIRLPYDRIPEKHLERFKRAWEKQLASAGPPNWKRVVFEEEKPGAIEVIDLTVCAASESN